VVVLATYFLRKFNHQFNRKLRGFSPAAIAALKGHPWRGNVRELENRMKRAVVMSDKPLLEPDDLELAAQDPKPVSLDLRGARAKAERDVIQLALAESGGNISSAAKLLGVSRPTLYDLVREYGLAVEA
jgi:two-component system NtrC family response regulator